MNTDTLKKLRDTAKEYAQKAYCPYSHYAVGAAVLASDGSVYGGCNVENASYSLTVCAERNAILKAVCDGHKKIKAVFVYSESGGMPYPCGACLQVMSEFCDDAEIAVSDSKTEEIYTLSQLLTKRFEK